MIVAGIVGNQIILGGMGFRPNRQNGSILKRGLATPLKVWQVSKRFCVPVACMGVVPQLLGVPRKNHSLCAADGTRESAAVAAAGGAAHSTACRLLLERSEAQAEAVNAISAHASWEASCSTQGYLPLFGSRLECGALSGHEARAAMTLRHAPLSVQSKSPANRQVRELSTFWPYTRVSRRDARCLRQRKPG